MNPVCDDLLFPLLHTLFRTFFITFLLSVSFFLPPAHAATENQPAPDPVKAESSSNISKDYFKGYLTDTGKILVSPLHADTCDWLKIGAVVAITGGLIVVDEDIMNLTQKNHSPAANTTLTHNNN